MKAVPLKCSWCKQGDTEEEHLGACPPTVDQEAAGNRIYSSTQVSASQTSGGCNLVAPQLKKKDTSAGLL